jgi:hypothetical protein
MISIQKPAKRGFELLGHSFLYGLMGCIRVIGYQHCRRAWFDRVKIDLDAVETVCALNNGMCSPIKFECSDFSVCIVTGQEIGLTQCPPNLN